MRRAIHAARCCLLALAAICGLLASVSAEPVVVRDAEISVAIDEATGSIVSLTDRATGRELCAPAGTAGSFRLLLALPDGTVRTILGSDQKLSLAEVSGNRVRLRWEGPLRDTTGAVHSICAQMQGAVDGGAAAFSFQIPGGVPGKLQEVAYPLVGGLAGLSPSGDASLWIPTSTPTEKPLAMPFGDVAYGYPGGMNLSFACVQSRAAGRALYFACQDPVARYKAYRFTETAGAEPHDVSASVQFTPLCPGGTPWDGPPVVVRFVEGDWRAAGRVYREWFAAAFGITQPKDDSIRRQSFFLMTMFMLPEGTINYTFRDIPRWARAAKEHGLEAVQISGWQMGGHDNGYPYYVPDPRLGTMAELEAEIRACHRMGLKVFFFVNYQPMMVESDWYRQELSRYREIGADGGFTWMAGWGMGTLWARMGHPKLMTWADLGFPEFRKIIVDQFADLARIGADGVHVDKMFPAALGYNPDSPLPPDTSTWEGAVRLTQEIMAEGRKLNPDWCMSFECNWDRMLQFGGATWWVGNQRITRSIFPENVETLALSQAYDYLGVNNAVRDGHAVMVVPMNFCRGVEWPPFAGLADYIKEVKRIRDDLQETVFWGEVLGQAEVQLAGAPPDGVQYNVFRNRDTGRRVCILTNSKAEARDVSLTGFGGAGDSPVRVRMPSRAARVVSMPAGVRIPPERVAFVEELGGDAR